MTEIYGVTGSVTGTSVTVRSGGTTAVSAAFETTVGLVGGYDAANGTATGGEVVQIESSAEAETAFGGDSELATQTALAFANGAGLVYAAPPAETEATETVTTASSYTLAEPPAFDPRVNTEHTIDITDTTEAVSVTVEYVDGTPTTPADANTAEVNPTTGEIAFDELSDYEVVYTYGDYTTAIENVAAKVPRSIGVCTENTSVTNTLLSELNTYDPNFDFMHGYVGDHVPEVSSYTNSFDDRRQAFISSARAYTDEGETEEVRTVGAVAGKQSGQALGDSTTGESLAGLFSLKTEYSNADAGTLIDAGVYVLRTDAGSIEVVKDRNTSTDPRFERIAWSEIVDEATEISNSISGNFVGKANTAENRLLLRESHNTSYRELQNDNLLDAFNVAVSVGADDNTVNLDIGLDVVDYMDRINVTITVGDVVLNGGAV